MSSQRGNVRKTGPPKHQNKKAFKNSLHDTSKKTKEINSLEVTGVCARCKDIIDWKIKYKKYKPLTVPKKCTKCEQKSVKRAYYMICTDCAKHHGVCAKCGEKKDIVQGPGLSAEEEASLNSQLQQELKMLPERKRRTFLRLQAEGKLSDTGSAATFEDNSDQDTDEDCQSEDEIG
ncbi:uncharacterized protein C9orf85 homolog [Lingula anatina]|uniref:Uncharacterized protein C9orf85 homolog n=1 Tax=Lingula anatina TaxID=7574 RepID=A0A1S3HTJ1_LINAN|nr:uncharacterized protein C9orf85 homolog [Lingula anatina]|eukprot:XP_013389338.1 uncharacterized protein C9orf85 homolog [Lingula anatina]